jgi:hypothetical protein
MGRGRFVAPRTISVRLNDGGRRVLSGERVFLNLGTHAAIPDVPGLRAARPMTSIEALELDYVPPHLIVLGGGYVGLELAQAYRRFGSRVTIIQHGPHVVGQEDDVTLCWPIRPWPRGWVPCSPTCLSCERALRTGSPHPVTSPRRPGWTARSDRRALPRGR